MSRTMVVTFPDGTVATRTSRTRVYTWAVMQTHDEHRVAQVCGQRAERLTQVLAEVERMRAADDLSGLTRKVTSQNGRGERFYSSYLPDDEDDCWYWLPDHLNPSSWDEYIDVALARIRGDIQRDRDKAARLAAGPRYSYAIAQWCSRRDLAEKACNNKLFKYADFVTTTAVPCTEQ